MDDDCDYPDYPDPDEDYSEPVGSCEWCGTNIYEDDFDGLCDQCAWHASLNEGTDDAGGDGEMWYSPND